MAGTESLLEQYRAVKPRLRGWQHAIAAPITGLAALALVLLAPPGMRAALLVFTVTTVLLFTVSAVYHRGSWSPRWTGILQRWDHANIFLVIAGSATPFAVAMLDEGPARTLLAVLWTGAVGGAAIRLLWIHAPRWLFVPMYLALGWASVMFVPEFLKSTVLTGAGHAVVLALLAAGGVLYTLGAVVFATKWPNPSPGWFGFHEVFHSFTLGAWTTHWAAAAVVLVAVR